MRLILDGSRPATSNMAIDEMLMKSAPCLRVYAWDKPSISIGYFQNVEETAKRFRCEQKNIPVVRRLTGGGLVFHQNDLTFSLVVAENSFLPRNVKDSYLKVTEALRIGLKDSYPGLDYAPCNDTSVRESQKERICFEKPSCYDLLWKGKKVMGASQRRLNGGILHQSTVFLEEGAKTLAEKIIRGFEQSWKISFEEKPLTDSELREAEKIEAERYASSSWAFGASRLLSSRNTQGSYKAASPTSGRN